MADVGDVVDAIEVLLTIGLDHDGSIGFFDLEGQWEVGDCHHRVQLLQSLLDNAVGHSLMVHIFGRLWPMLYCLPDFFEFLYLLHGLDVSAHFLLNYNLSIGFTVEVIIYFPVP